MEFAQFFDNSTWLLLATGVYLFFYIMFVVSVIYRIGPDPIIMPIAMISFLFGFLGIFYWPVLLPVELAVCFGIIFARKLR